MSFPSSGGSRWNRSTLIILGVGALIVIVGVLFRNSGGGSGSSPTSAAPSPSAAPTLGGVVTCPVIQTDAHVAGRVKFKRGGIVPLDMPVPGPPPALTCTGTGSDNERIIAAAWPDVTEAAYIEQLVKLGWTQQAQGTVQRFEKTGASHAVLVYTLGHDLVALFGPPPPG